MQRNNGICKPYNLNSSFIKTHNKDLSKVARNAANTPTPFIRRLRAMLLSKPFCLELYGNKKSCTKHQRSETINVPQKINSTSIINMCIYEVLPKKPLVTTKFQNNCHFESNAQNALKRQTLKLSGYLHSRLDSTTLKPTGNAKRKRNSSLHLTLPRQKTLPKGKTSDLDNIVLGSKIAKTRATPCIGGSPTKTLNKVELIINSANKPDSLNSSRSSLNDDIYPLGNDSNYSKKQRQNLYGTVLLPKLTFNHAEKPRPKNPSYIKSEYRNMQCKSNHRKHNSFTN